MKNTLASLLLTAMAAAAHAQALPAPEIAARDYVLVDMTSGQTLAEHDADAVADPASLTKIMTAYVVFQALKDHKLSLEQQLPVSTRAWEESRGGRTGESVMFLAPNMHPTVDELLQGLIVQSGNDAAVALAEGVAGSTDAFVALMNRQAQAWGLKNTAFRNVTGVTEPGHHTTARDMAVMSSHLISDFPEYYHYYSQREFTFNRIKQGNRNVLLERDPSVDGLKTGYTDAAGYCLVASAHRQFPNGQRRLLSVVMGTATKMARADESQKLLNWGFTAFDDVRLAEAGKPIASVKVWKGASPQVRLGSASAVYVSVPRGEGDKLKTVIERTDPLVAPLAKGQRVGTLKVSTSTGMAVASVPLVVLDAVPAAGLFGRAWDAIRLWIK